MRSDDLGVVSDALGEALEDLTSKDAVRYIGIACKVLKKMIPMIPMQYQWIALLVLFILLVVAEVLMEEQGG